MSKSKSKAESALFTKITLIAKPTGKQAKRLADGPVTVLTMRRQPPGEDEFIEVAGFSAGVWALDTRNAFEARHISDVIAQFEANVTRGWKYMAIAVEPVEIR